MRSNIIKKLKDKFVKTNIIEEDEETEYIHSKMIFKENHKEDI